ILDDATVERIEALFKSRGLTMAPNNARQALILTASEILVNHHGSARGLWIPSEKNHVILLPGPPSELKPMFDRYCVPRFKKLAGGISLARRVFRTTGLGESSLDARIAPIYSQYKNIETTVLGKPGQVEISL